MRWFGKLLLALGLAAIPLAPAVAQPVYGPKDDAAEGGWDGKIELAAAYASRDREIISDYERSGASASAVIGYTLPAGKTVLRAETSFDASKYATGLGAEAQVSQTIGQALTASVTASADKDLVTLESRETDQAAIRAGIAFEQGSERVEVFARHRWRHYRDSAGGDSTGWQFGAKLRHRFAAYHWIALGLGHDRINDNGGSHGYRRSAFSLDYSRPAAKRLRLLASVDYRHWTWAARHVGDIASQPLRHDRVIRPELALSWGRPKGLYARASAGYDFYRSNDPRYSGDGPRLRAAVGFRF